jgi:hypothetical protein
VSYHNPRTEIAATIASGMIASGRAWDAEKAWKFADDLLAADPEAAPAAPIEPSLYEKALEEQNARLTEALTLIMENARARLASDVEVMTTVIEDSFRRIGYVAHQVLAHQAVRGVKR